MDVNPDVNQQKKKKKRKKKVKKKQSTLLSFGDEEDEGQAFQVKKAKTSFSYDKKRKRKKRKQATVEKSLGNRAYLQSSAGMYTKEALAALKSNAIHLTSTSKSESKAPKEKQEVKEHEGDIPEKMEEDDEDPNLPGREEIAVARRKRELMRARGTNDAPDFVPLRAGVAPNRKEMYGVVEDEEHGGLVTEEGDDNEQDVFDDRKGNRIQFGDPGKVGNGEIDQESRFEISKGNRNDDDEEYNRWIDQQIRKGGGKLPQHSQYTSITDGKSGVKKYKPSQQQANIDVAAQMKRLKGCLSSLKENYSKEERELVQLNVEIGRTEGELKTFEADLKSMNTQYLFYQSLRDKIVDCLDCLNVKAPLIEEAMEEMKEIMLSKSKAVRKQEDLHLRDESNEAFGIKVSEKKVTVDEFGRNIEMEFEIGKENRRKARENRRKKSGTGLREQGYWTDDEEELDSSYSDRKKNLLQDCARIFGDVDDDFKTIDVVKNKLEQLKRKYPQAYMDTYISLSVPSLFAPYIRLELLRWDYTKNPRLDTMEWYQTLSDYGLFGDVKQDDPDLDVIPKVVEKVVTPYLTNYFFTTWDPVSNAQYDSAVALVREILDHVDGKLENPQKMLAAILDRFHHLVNSHSKYKVEPQTNDRNSYEWEFCEWRWWRAHKILTRLLSWQEALSAKVIRELAESHFQDNLLPFLSKEMKTMPPRPKLILNLVQALNENLPTELRDSKSGVYSKLYAAVKTFFHVCKKKGADTKDLQKIKALMRF